MNNSVSNLSEWFALYAEVYVPWNEYLADILTMLGRQLHQILSHQHTAYSKPLHSAEMSSLQGLYSH